ncbi:hypothetical protein RB213_001907 [Colletotrichum asianum]
MFSKSGIITLALLALMLVEFAVGVEVEGKCGQIQPRFSSLWKCPRRNQPTTVYYPSGFTLRFLIRELTSHGTYE